MDSYTVTIQRGEKALTVGLVPSVVTRLLIIESMDEDGTHVKLTPEERAQARDLVRAGVDETGV